jgi:signal peptidase II
MADDPAVRRRAMLRFGLVTALIVLVLDQILKVAVLDLLDGGARAIVVTPFFNLVLVWNRGVSFGMLQDLGAILPWALTAIALAVIIGLIVWLSRTGQRLVALGLGLVIGGALGNVVDRARYGAVADFLDFHLAGYHWPAFNLADAAICIGAVILIADGLLAPRRQYT